MRIFDTFESVEGMLPCMKRPVIVHAKKIDDEFRVKTLEGDYKQGKSGDYLMQGIDGELYICDGFIFERTYDFMESNNDY
jgi:PGDYG protein